MKKFFLLFLILTIGCIKEMPKRGEIPSGYNKIIEKIPSAEISSFSKISIDFTQDIPEAKIREEINAKEIFEFTPKIEGRAYWEREDLLTFYPFLPLKPNQQYKCKLNLSILSSYFKDYPPLEITFKVFENEIYNFSHSFEKDSSSEDKLKQLFNLSFFMTEDKFKLEEVKKGIEVLLKGEKIYYKLEKSGSKFDLKFSFITPERGGEILVKFSKEGLKLNKEMNFWIPIAPSKKFKAEDIQVKWEKEGPKVYVTFSNPLKEDEKFEDFIRIEPEVELQFSLQGNLLKISGDFQHNISYKITILPNLKNFIEEKLSEEQNFTFQLKDMPPELHLPERKIYLSSKSNKNLRFKTVNINSLRIYVYYIPIQNLIFFLQDFEENYERDAYYDYERTGKLIYSEKILIPAEKNRWIEQDLNLNVPENLPDKGVFYVKFDFKKEDAFINCEGYDEHFYDYENPCSYSYYYDMGRDSAIVVISDIAILVLKEKNKWNLWAYNLLTGKPEDGVEIEAFEYQNLLVEKSVTNNNGYASFSKENISFFVGKKGKNLSFIRTSAASPPLEPFDLKGSVSSSKEGIKAFVYTERSVYRPSDDIHLVSILREDISKPVDVPLKCIFKNPLNQNVSEEVNSKPINGVYYFKLKTDIDSPTGLWYANLYLGEELLASHPIRVESIVPPKIKPEISIEKEKLSFEELPIVIGLSSNYLFGAPSSGLKFNLKAKMEATDYSFSKFKGFKFSSPYKKFSKEEKIMEGNLDEEGIAICSWSFKKDEDTPNFLKTDFILEVTEKGGRPAYDRKSILIFPYNYYVGVKFDSEKIYKSGEEVNISYIVVDKEGNPVEEKDLDVKVYFVRYYWWYEIRNFKEIISSNYTEVVNSFSLKSKKDPSSFDVLLSESYGTYFVEIRDKKENESLFFSIPVRFWGEEQAEVGGSYLKFEGAKENYNIGEIMDLSLSTPEEGTLFYSIVKGDEILKWDNKDLKETNTKLKIKITEDMVPSSYLFISAIQKIGLKNDIPLRSYAIIPFNVMPEKGKLEMDLMCPDKIKPREEFSIKVKLLNSSEGVITVAVVDSGLINLTQEKTPDPYLYFYQKMAWNLKYLDSFDYFYGLLDIPADYTYKIGGEGAGQKLLVSPVKSNPFPPVVFFKGPIYVKGEEEIKVTLPDYLGEVKVIVVGTWGKSFGSKERFIKVVDDLIPFATFPRAVAPGDEFEIPLQLFIQKTKKEKIKIEIFPSKHFEILGDKSIELPFEEGEKMVFFKAKAKENEIGEGEIRILLKDKKKKEVSQLIPIHPINTYISKDEFYTIQPKEEKEFKVQVFGFPEMAKANLTISNFQNIPLRSIYQTVLQYPFGCVEQTSSKLFATLYLRDLVILYGEIFPDLNKSKLDSVLEEGFRRLQNFIFPEGSFSFWPSERYPASEWTNVYVAHLLVEANLRGFSLQSFVNKTTDYQKTRARMRIENPKAQAYRLFVLSLNSTPDFSSMNLLKENYLSKLDKQGRLILAASYAQAKDYSTAKEIIKTIDKVEEIYGSTEYFYSRFGYFGNYLYFLSKIDKELASKVFYINSKVFNKNEWWSTHDAGWFCAGISSYLSSIKISTEKIRAKIKFPDREEEIKRDENIYSVDLKDYISKNIKITNESKGTLFINLNYSGIPIELPTKEEYRNMKIRTTFLDENGTRIDEKRLKMGSVIYEKIDLELFGYEKYIALSQILPGGWEPINLRLLNLLLPEWAQEPFQPSYVDIRDDRVNIFLDNPEYQRKFTFYIPIKVVTKGKFILPPTAGQAMYNPEFFAILPQGYVNVE